MAQTRIYDRILPINPLKTLALLLFFAAFAPAAENYSNPVIPEIGPADPAVIRHDGMYYMYCTGDDTSYRVYTSWDLVNWNRGRKVFIPGGNGVWAPDIYYHPENQTFYLYYTAGWNIGVATSSAPDTNFTNQGLLVNNMIDAHLFRDDDGSLYLFYSDVAHIYVQRMANPTTLQGSRTEVVRPTVAWEKNNGNVTEGPWVLKRNGVYYMLYSGSHANSQYYSVGYATATNPMGPWTKYAGNPIITGGDGVYGPGHGAVTTDDAGNLWHVHHQKNAPDPAWDRFICIDRLWFGQNGVLYGRATRGVEKPAPVINNDFRRMVAHWPLDGNYSDASGLGHHATGRGSVQFVPGADDANPGAVRVSPAGGSALAGSWDPSEYTGDLSVSFWLNWAGPDGTWQAFVAKRDGVWNNAQSLWQVCTNQNGNPLWLQSPRGLVEAPNALVPGQWQHVVATFDGFVGRVYIDAKLLAEGNFRFGDAVDAAVALGCDSGDQVPAAHFMNGTLDDVRIYNYPLSELQIAQLYTDVAGGAVCMESLRPDVGDFNGDCIVNLLDFAMFAGEWLACGIYPQCYQ